MRCCLFSKGTELYSRRMVLQDMGPADCILGHWLLWEVSCALLVSDAISYSLVLSCPAYASEWRRMCLYTRMHAPSDQGFQCLGYTLQMS